MVCFSCATIEGKSESGSEEDQIAGPKDGHKVHPELTEFVLFVHRISLGGQLPLLA